MVTDMLNSGCKIGFIEFRLVIAHYLFLFVGFSYSAIFIASLLSPSPLNVFFHLINHQHTPKGLSSYDKFSCSQYKYRVFSAMVKL